MKKERKSQFVMPTKANTAGELEGRTELDRTPSSHTVDRYAGDSVDKHREIEKANEHFANEEISQVIDNS
ncbi:hypothetical protein [Halalkalibacter lacteus]|uniref:hypothetical protein n=1 Tax=Halalkalibacter lacteus TaxID=3090663 RepID=UPI002FCC2936